MQQWLCVITEAQNGLALKGPLKAIYPNPLQWSGTSSTWSGCSELQPIWPWMCPGMGHLPLDNLSHCFSSLIIKNFFLTSAINLLFFFLLHLWYHWLKAEDLIIAVIWILNRSCYKSSKGCPPRFTPRKKELSRRSVAQVLGSESSSETLQLQTHRARLHGFLLKLMKHLRA